MTVKLIVDGLGSEAAAANDFFTPLRDGGVEVCRFVPRWGRRYLLRNHQKLALADGETLVDLRGAERFAGQTEPLDAVAGHVPGAVNLPYTENLAASGRFRAPAELAGLWHSRAGAAPGRAQAAGSRC